MTFVSTLVQLLLSPAQACGGFACDLSGTTPPVLQAAERIVFGVDEAQNEVEMHVQITFDGAADDFAWIVPVPDVPDLFLTTSLLFTQVATSTLPTFQLVTTDEGHCDDEELTDAASSYDSPVDGDSAGSSSGDDDDGGYDVTVVAEEAIGPYETVTLAADSAEDLLGWLGTQGYELPPTFEDVLAPYVSRGAHFVALKLSANNDTSDLAPLGLRFVANKAMVPVQLTSVSATPDMRMEAYVFGDGRGVPESYYHVQINSAAIDWWNAGANYDDVITEAANEAGGHAFATDYFGPSSIVPTLYRGSYDEASLRSATSAEDWAQRVRATLTLTPPELFQVLEDQLPLPSGQGASWWACPSCSSSSSSSTFAPNPFPDFDPNLATDDLIARVYEPLESAQSLLDRFPRLARMTSSLDAIEMTVDPVFVLNHDLHDVGVSKDHSARLVYECGNDRKREKADRRLELEGGWVIDLPSDDWMNENGMTDYEYIRDLRFNNAVVIEQMAAEGDPVILTDHRPEMQEIVDLLNRQLGCGGSGGCSTVGGGATVILGTLTALLARRRRQAP